MEVHFKGIRDGNHSARNSPSNLKVGTTDHLRVKEIKSDHGHCSLQAPTQQPQPCLWSFHHVSIETTAFGVFQETSVRMECPLLDVRGLSFQLTPYFSVNTLAETGMKFNSHSAYSPTRGCFQGGSIGGWGLPESEFLCWEGLHLRAMGPLGISAQALQFVSLDPASDLCHQQRPASSPVTLTNLDCSVT